MAKWRVNLKARAAVTLTVEVEADDEDTAIELAEKAGLDEDEGLWMITDIDTDRVEAVGRAKKLPKNKN
jgi:hypothetical protein